MNYEQVALALDFDTEEEIKSILSKLEPKPGVLKIGLQITSKLGIENTLEFIKKVSPKSDIFLDLKLHDIPNTVKKAVNNLQKFNINYLTVHALGGEKMLRESIQVIEQKLNLVAVTVLTSHSEEELKNMGLPESENLAIALAKSAYNSGVRWLVCSSSEVKILKEKFPEIKLIVPGIRPKSSITDDQSRIATPKEALQKGADIIVIGRAITNAINPQEVWSKLFNE